MDHKNQITGVLAAKRAACDSGSCSGVIAKEKDPSLSGVDDDDDDFFWIPSARYIKSQKQETRKSLSFVDVTRRVFRVTC
jgi:hypothetical protein